MTRRPRTEFACGRQASEKPHSTTRPQMVEQRDRQGAEALQDAARRARHQEAGGPDRLLSLAAALAGVVTLIVLGGCTEGPSAEPPASRSTGVSPSTVPMRPLSLRGTAIDALECLPTPPMRPQRVVTGAPIEIVLCGLEGGKDVRQLSSLRSSDGGIFNLLLEALSLPDRPRTVAEPCPSTWARYTTVLLRTDHGSWNLHEPTGACGLPLTRVRRALSSALAAAGNP